MKATQYILVISIAFGCSEKEVDYRYFENGKVKTRAEVLRGKKDGELLEYYENGNLKFKQNWKNGLLDGPYEEFYSDGSIYRKGFLKNDNFTKLTSYFRSGKILTMQYYDGNGDIVEIKKYNEDGSRNREAFPFLYTIPYGDTLKKGGEVILKARIVNITDSIFANGQLIITSSLDTITRNKMIQVRDTLELLYPQNIFDYAYKFIPLNNGEGSVSGQFIFTKEQGDEIKVRTLVFTYPFYVID